MAWFLNQYRCARCHREWTDEWFATCDDDCPHCGARHMTPHHSEEIAPPKNRGSEIIAKLNDAFRKTFHGGKVILVGSVEALPDCVKAHALVQVANFDRFTSDNDPHGEHDFGSFELVGRRFFWKIDYYDKSLEAGSEDPGDPDMTTRVLTLMLAEDY